MNPQARIIAAGAALVALVVACGLMVDGTHANDALATSVLFVGLAVLAR